MRWPQSDVFHLSESLRSILSRAAITWRKVKLSFCKTLGNKQSCMMWSSVKFYINWTPLLVCLSDLEGFPRSTLLNFRSAATVTCVLWVRFPSIEAWISWTPKPCWTPKCCCPHPNIDLEMRATWEPWAPSVRSVASRTVTIHSEELQTKYDQMVVMAIWHCCIRRC